MHGEFLCKWRGFRQVAELFIAVLFGVSLILFY